MRYLFLAIILTQAALWVADQVGQSNREAESNRVLAQGTPLWHQGSYAGDNWQWIQNIGFLYPAGDSGWAYHEELQWLYSPSSSLTDIHFFWNGYWYWTNAETYPFIYSSTDTAWVYFLQGSSPRYFFNIGTGHWINYDAKGSTSAGANNAVQIIEDGAGAAPTPPAPTTPTPTDEGETPIIDIDPDIIISPGGG